MDSAPVVNAILVALQAVAAVGLAVLLVKSFFFMWKSIMRRMID